MEPGIIYQIVASIIGILFGVLIISFRKKFLKLQKKYLPKRKDILNQTILESLNRRSEKNTYILYIFVGSGFVIAGIYTLINLL